MPVVRLSGRVEGPEDPNRKSRAKLLYRLFEAGWDIYNGNGDQFITLSNIQDKIIESDAFVFTPDARLQDMFKAASIFVGYQTHDADLRGKPTILLNTDSSWGPLINLLQHLRERGTITQDPREFLIPVLKPKQVVIKLQETYDEKSGQPSHEHKHENIEPFVSPDYEGGKTTTNRPNTNICVFCSASIKKQEYLDAGYDLGRLLAESGVGCISGAGRTGIMGQIVTGAHENGGYCAGSNVPHIIRLEGLPEGLDEFWPRSDIYTRMEVMIKNSDAFIIMPGGTGTVQEVLALIVLQQQGSDLMKDARGRNKPIVIVNHIENNVFFWNPLLELLDAFSASHLFKVTQTHGEALEICLRECG